MVGVGGLSQADHDRRLTQRRWEASLAIQRVYRGFRVRKAIRPLLSRKAIPADDTSDSEMHYTQDHVQYYGEQNSPNTLQEPLAESPPESPHYYARYSTPSPPREPRSTHASYSPLASPPLQPDHMSIINIFTRGVLDGKYRVAMEDNGLLSLSLNKPPARGDTSLEQVNGIIQTINQTIENTEPELAVQSPKRDHQHPVVHHQPFISSHQELSPSFVDEYVYEGSISVAFVFCTY